MLWWEVLSGLLAATFSQICSLFSGKRVPGIFLLPARTCMLEGCHQAVSFEWVPEEERALQWPRLGTSGPVTGAIWLGRSCDATSRRCLGQAPWVLAWLPGTLR